MGPTQDRSEIAFFDVETTVPTRPGQRFAILEFGAILVCPKKLEELHNYSTLVRPADPLLISSLSVRCNGITPDAVVSAPTFADIADTVFDILHGRIWAGHNILRFDCARIREAFAEIGLPAPEPKGTIDSLALLTQRFGRRAGDMKLWHYGFILFICDNCLLLDADMLISVQMASLATYFGLGQQTHRSLDDVRMNLEVLKYCATVLFLKLPYSQESSLPDIFTVNSWVSPNATTRSRSNAKSSPEGTSQNLSTPSSKFKFENASNASPPDQGKEEIHPIFSLVTQGTAEVDSVLAGTTADQPNPFDMNQLSNQMETQSLQPDDTMEDKSAPESHEMCSMASVSEGSSGYAGFMEPDEVSLSSISDGVVPLFPGSQIQKIKLLHNDVILQLCCSRLKIRFGISTKFVDQAGRPRLSFVVDIAQSLCTVLDACEVIVRKLVEDSGSSSEWRHVVTRKGGFFNHPTARLHIPTVVFGNVAQYATEMYQKEASGTIQKLVFVKFDAAELDSLLKPGTFVDAFLSLDPYDYQQSAGIRLVVTSMSLNRSPRPGGMNLSKSARSDGMSSSRSPRPGDNFDDLEQTTSTSRCPHVPVCPSSHLFRVVAAPHGTLTAASWANVGSRISRNGSGKAQLPRFCEIVFPLFGVRVPARVRSIHLLGVSLSRQRYLCLSVPDSDMSNRKRKLIVDEGDEESGDSGLNVPIPTDFLGPSSSVGPSHGRDTLEYPRPLVVSSSPELALVKNRGGPASSSGENHSFGGVGISEGVGDGEGSSSGPSRSAQRRNLGHRVEADSYPIDFMACATTPTDLFKLRNLYNIPSEVLLVVPGKGDVPSRPLKEYVTMHLESFKLGARLPLQSYFAKILGGMHLAPVKHLYQLRSSPKEAGWYYFMSSSAKRKPITGFSSSCKNWKNKFFFAGGNWCPAVRSLESWGLIGGLEDRPLLQVETALLNASTCQDLLSPTSLVGSGLVDIAAGMDSKILSAMTRKRGRASSSSSNPPPPPKKPSVGPSKTPVPALPPPPPRKSVGEKTSDKSPEVRLQSGDCSSPLLSRDQVDYLSPYQKDYKKAVGPNMVKDIESMNLSELAASVQRVSFRLATMVSCYKIGSAHHEKKLQADNQELKKKAESADRSKEKLAELNKQIMELEERVAVAESTSSKLEGELGDLRSDLHATQIERDTLRAALEGEIKSLGEQLAEEKGKSTDVDDRLDAEYDSGVAFSYKCIMSVLKEEYPELDMSKLEAGVERYMAEVGQGDKEQGGQDQVEAPSDGVQEGEAGGRTLEKQALCCLSRIYKALAAGLSLTEQKQALCCLSRIFEALAAGLSLTEQKQALCCLSRIFEDLAAGLSLTEQKQALCCLSRIFEALAAGLSLTEQK
ncbi:protein NEN1 [Citrus sinensis]|nr:protein NEN1 [Citrus sinensis]